MGSGWIEGNRVECAIGRQLTNERGEYEGDLDRTDRIVTSWASYLEEGSVGYVGTRRGVCMRRLWGRLGSCWGDKGARRGRKKLGGFVEGGRNAE